MKHRITDNISNNPNGKSTGKTAEIYFFHVDWCKYCVDALPEWYQFSRNMEGKVINGYTIHCVGDKTTDSTNSGCNLKDPNCQNRGTNLTDTKSESGVNDALRQQYSIKTFPTVRLICGKKEILLDATPTESTMNKFVETILSDM
jgi:thiol-disulfide isomerase/thioredoxin